MDTLRNPWKGYCAHFIRFNKQTNKRETKRCKIGDWAVAKCVITMIVEFQQGGVKKRKSVSPQALAAVNCFWIEENFVASEEDEDRPPEPAKNSFYVDAPKGLLPLLDVKEQEMLMIPIETKTALLFCIRETNDLLSIGERNPTVEPE